MIRFAHGSFVEQRRGMDAIGRWSFMFAIDGLRYAIPASLGFYVFWIWKRDAFAHRRIQKTRPHARALRREVMYSLSTIAIFATVGLAIFYLKQAGLLRVYDEVAARGWWYWAASIGLAILIHDTYFYWTHRAMHHPWLYRRVHRVHHLSTNPSPWAAYSFAPIEAVVEAAVVPLILVTIPMHESAVFVFLIYMIVMNVLGHMGIELYPRGFSRSKWTSWLSTSVHHNLHHRDFHGNYGLYFTWWDRIMGTQHRAYHEEYDRVTRTSSPPA